MKESPQNSLDVLGIQPFAKSVDRITSASVDGARAFFSRICLPAAEEFGFALRDVVKSWRLGNKVTLAARAEQKLNAAGAPANVQPDPRLVFNILEEGSWVEDAVLQDFWSGLLTSSCTASGDDDSNLIFVNLLSELTKLQARILRFAVAHCDKYVTENGFIQAKESSIPREELFAVAEDADVDRLDREMDHLRASGLIRGGFYVGDSLEAQVAPTPLALHMFVRCQGTRSTPIEYFDLTPQTAADPDPPE